MKYIADFETTVFDGQEKTEVWAAAIVKEGTEDVQVFNSIEDFWDYVLSIMNDETTEIYFHNLKFDGTFILSYLLNVLHKEQALIDIEHPDYKDIKSKKFLRNKEMPNDSITYLISDLGMWYEITYKDKRGFIVEFKDSLKLIPLSVKKAGKAFNTKHQKLNIEYKGERHAGGVITDEEKEYIKNDVLVIKECLEYMWNEGHSKLTIGACCLSEFKKLYKDVNVKRFEDNHPDLRTYKLDKIGVSEIYGAENAEEYIRNAYRGGWCYVNKYWAGKEITDGCTADVNSLYPSMMHSSSGNYYPCGYPKFWTGEIPDYLIQDTQHRYYYYVRVKTRFYLKPGKLPFISIKNNILYKAHEILETSDVYNHKTGHYCKWRTDPKTGDTIPTTVTLTLTCTDWQLLQEHYNLEDTEILDGCWFFTEIGIFDNYINKWADIKKKSTGGMRQIAKLFLNNLYGKLAASDRSDFKVAGIGEEDKTLHYKVYNAKEKKPGYIPIGAAITSYAREFTIRAAQANYHKDLPGFLYADTDSIHCNIPQSALSGVPIDDVEFNHWAIENHWDKAKFVRAKTYMEREDGKWDVKCAGMPQRCKDLFTASITGDIKPLDECDDLEGIYWYDEKGKPIKRSVDDFDYGLQVPGKLIATQIEGGTVLKEGMYTLNKI